MIRPLVKFTHMPLHLKCMRLELNTIDSYEVLAMSNNEKGEIIRVIDVPGNNPIAVYENEVYAVQTNS